MRRELAAALLVLSLSYIVVISAQNNTTAPVKVALQQKTGDGYAGEQEPYRPSSSGGPSKEQPYYGAEHDEHACPEAKPADAVKEVYKAHGTFTWRNMAAHNHRHPERKHKAAPLNKAEALPGSIMARVSAFVSKAADTTKAAAQAVTGASFLFPTSIDAEECGLPGTTDVENSPPSEALAVGRHPTDEDLVFVLHAINAQAEVFPVEKGGKPVESVTPTKLNLLDLAEQTTLDVEGLGISRLAAFYDHDKEHYVLIFSTYAHSAEVTITPPVFVAISLTKNPLDAWMIWALDLKPDVAEGVTMCAELDPQAFHMGQMQASYSEKGLYISAGATCTFDDTKKQVLSTLYVFSKEALCRPPSVESPERDVPKIYAALYHAPRSWYRSVTEEELELVDDMYEPFNSFIAPARPQTEEDVEGKPLFAMKVSQSHLSIATLTEEPDEGMCDIESAPQIKAVVVGKGADFTNTPANSTDGSPLMHQPGADSLKLAVKGLGMPEPYGGVTYWASEHKGLLYVVTGEYWGNSDVRVPSVYWAILKPTDDICQLTREDQGMVASQDGLSLAYPVIAARHDGSAVVAYSYSGAGKMASSMFQAFPGVATTVVGKDAGYGPTQGGIDVVQRGPGSLTHADIGDVAPWGYNSAAHVCGDEMWFAVPVTTAKDSGFDYGSWLSYKNLR